MSNGVKYSIAEVTTPHQSFEEDLRLYRECGADGIGIHVRPNLTDPDAALRAFRESGLEASLCVIRRGQVLPRRSGTAEEDPKEAVEGVLRALEEIAPFEPACCMVGPGPYGDLEHDRAWELAVEGLRTVARRAADLGLTIGVEPIHRSISEIFSLLTDLPRTLQMCDDIGEANVGVVFDVWHLWDTPDVDAHIRANAHRIVGVQVDDTREPTRAWYDRVLPGDGVSGVAHLLGVLRDAGYQGWLDLELISDDGLYAEGYEDSLWRRDPRDLVDDGLARMRSMWGA